MVARFLVVIVIAAVSLSAAPVRPSAAQIMSWRVATPYPDYPVEAQRRGATGAGMYKIHFVADTGTVRYVQIVKSTGDKSLDDAAVRAFRRWRFKSGVLPTLRMMAEKPSKEPFADVDFVVKVPVSFTLGHAEVGGQFGSRR